MAEFDKEFIETIKWVEEEFSKKAYTDEDIVQIFSEWDLIIEHTSYTWKDCLIPCLKDTILRLQERLETQHKQLFTTTAN